MADLTDNQITALEGVADAAHARRLAVEAVTAAERILRRKAKDARATGATGEQVASSAGMARQSLYRFLGSGSK